MNTFFAGRSRRLKPGKNPSKDRTPDFGFPRESTQTHNSETAFTHPTSTPSQPTSGLHWKQVSASTVGLTSGAQICPSTPWKGPASTGFESAFEPRVKAFVLVWSTLCMCRTSCKFASVKPDACVKLFHKPTSVSMLPLNCTPPSQSLRESFYKL